MERASGLPGCFPDSSAFIALITGCLFPQGTDLTHSFDCMSFDYFDIKPMTMSPFFCPFLFLPLGDMFGPVFLVSAEEWGEAPHGHRAFCVQFLKPNSRRISRGIEKTCGRNVNRWSFPRERDRERSRGKWGGRRWWGLHTARRPQRRKAVGPRTTLPSRCL